MTVRLRGAARMGIPGLVTMALAAGGCGGSGHSAKSDTASTIVTPTATSTTAKAPPAADAARLRAIVLQPADLPAGWRSTPTTPDVLGATDNAALAKCVGVRDTTFDEVASVKSDEFSLGNARIASSAASYRSASDIAVDVSALRDRRFSSCLELVLRNQLTGALPAGSAVKNFKMQITPGSPAGPANVVATGAGTFTVVAVGQQLSFAINIAFMTGPLIETQVSFFSVGSEVAPTLRNEVIAKMAARAAMG